MSAAHRKVEPAGGEAVTRGELLTMLDGGVGIHQWEMWRRGLLGRRLILRNDREAGTFALGSWVGDRVEVRDYQRGSHVNGVAVGALRFTWSPREVCRRMVLARGRQEIVEPQEAAGAGV